MQLSTSSHKALSRAVHHSLLIVLPAPTTAWQQSTNTDYSTYALLRLPRCCMKPPPPAASVKSSRCTEATVTASYWTTDTRTTSCYSSTTLICGHPATSYSQLLQPGHPVHTLISSQQPRLPNNPPHTLIRGHTSNQTPLATPASLPTPWTRYSCPVCPSHLPRTGWDLHLHTCTRATRVVLCLC
jgi:hypothetical protein